MFYYWSLNIYCLFFSLLNKAIYDLLGEEKRGSNSPEVKVDQIFSKMDVNSDQKLSKEEFVTGCLQDDYLRKLLAPSASWINIYNIYKYLFIVLLTNSWISATFKIIFFLRVFLFCSKKRIKLSRKIIRILSKDNSVVFSSFFLMNKIDLWCHFSLILFFSFVSFFFLFDLVLNIYGINNSKYLLIIQ